MTWLMRFNRLNGDAQALFCGAGLVNTALGTIRIT